MKSNVIPIEALSKHVCVATPEKVHVIPAVWFDKFVMGEMALTSLEDHEEVMRSIVSCWLASLRKTH